MLFKKVSRRIQLMCLAVIFSTGCIASGTDLSLENTTESKLKTECAENTTAPVEKEESIADNWVAYNKVQFPLIAALPEEYVGLYGIKGNGMILKIHGVGFYYPWRCTVPYALQ